MLCKAPTPSRGPGLISLAPGGRSPSAGRCRAGSAGLTAAASALRLPPRRPRCPAVTAVETRALRWRLPNCTRPRLWPRGAPPPGAPAAPAPTRVRTLSQPPAGVLGEKPGRASQSPASLAPGRRSPRGSWAGLASRRAGLSRGRHLRLLQEHGFFVNCPAASRSVPPALYPPPTPRGTKARGSPPRLPRGLARAPQSGVPVWAAFPNLNFQSGGGGRAQPADAASGPTAATPSAAPEWPVGSRLHLRGATC